MKPHPSTNPAASRARKSQSRAGSLSSLILAGSLILPGSAVFAQGDAAEGEKAFRQCAACHTVEEGQPSRMGPNLYNLFGRNVGDVDGFAYSKVYTEANEAGDVWTPEKFVEFIENPRAVYSSNRMVLQVRKPEQRADLTAFLLTKSPDYEADSAE